MATRMLTPEQKETIQTYLSAEPMAVLATADAAGTPGAAVILFAEDDDLNIIFGTHPTFKYRNLKANHKAAFAFYKEWSSVQMHGTAEEVPEAELETAKQLFMSKHPDFDKHLIEGSVFFKFTPTWLRLTDNSTKPPVMWEAKL